MADVKETFKSNPWKAMFVLTLFVFITLAVWGSAMSFYFQSNIDQAALYGFIEKCGLADIEGTRTGVGASILGAFNLIAHSQADAYSIGFSLFNMIGAIVQFLGVILLSEFLANRYGKKRVFVICLSLTAFFTACFYLPEPTDVTSIYLLCVLKSLAYAPTVPLLRDVRKAVLLYLLYIQFAKILQIFEKPKPLLNILRTHNVSIYF